jgi:NADP-dependent 3-hydroxy acid dehydrogenase YdfG
MNAQHVVVITGASQGIGAGLVTGYRVLYLENAHFVTGEILHVDGGQSAGH